jgi:hypothetical protein
LRQHAFSTDAAGGRLSQRGASKATWASLRL